MDSIPCRDEFRSGGGKHDIRISVTYEDEESPEYHHTVCYGFKPYIKTGAEDARFEISNGIHKKYWKELDEIEPHKFTTSDGSELVETNGMMTDGEIKPDDVPNCVWDKLEKMFGNEIVNRTKENGGEEAFGPDIPDNHTVRVERCILRIHGSCSEEISKDDERVKNGNYASHLKDAETGEILHEEYVVNHRAEWSFGVDTGEKPTIIIEECYHKSYDDGMVGDPNRTEYEREKTVTHYDGVENTPSITSVPDDIIDSLAEWVGIEIVKRSVENSGGSLPTRIVECFDCDSVNEVHPRKTCPECGSDAVGWYESLDQYNDVSDRSKEIAEHISRSEITTKTEEEL